LKFSVSCNKMKMRVRVIKLKVIKFALFSIRLTKSLKYFLCLYYISHKHLIRYSFYVDIVWQKVNIELGRQVTFHCHPNCKLHFTGTCHIKRLISYPNIWYILLAILLVSLLPTFFFVRGVFLKCTSCGNTSLLFFCKYLK